MPKATLTSKGQITLPKEVRSRLGVAAGDHVEFAISDDGSITIRSVKKSALRLHGVIDQSADRPVPVEDLDQAIADHLTDDDERIRSGRS